MLIDAPPHQNSPARYTAQLIVKIRFWFGRSFSLKRTQHNSVFYLSHPFVPTSALRALRCCSYKTNPTTASVRYQRPDLRIPILEIDVTFTWTSCPEGNAIVIITCGHIISVTLNWKVYPVLQIFLTCSNLKDRIGRAHNLYPEVIHTSTSICWWLHQGVTASVSQTVPNWT